MSHEEAAEKLDAEADQMEERSEELGHDTERVETEWRAKEQDGGVPGAQPAEADEEDVADEPSHGPATGGADVEDERT